MRTGVLIYKDVLSCLSSEAKKILGLILHKVLSGPLIFHSQLFYEVCVEAAKRRRPWDKGRQLVFSRGRVFAENAISIGAAALVVEHYLEPEALG